MMRLSAAFSGLIVLAANAMAEPGACPDMAQKQYKLTENHKYQVLHRIQPTASILIKLEKYKTGPGDNDYHAAIEVNSDGSPRAYHLLDPEGKEYALNDLYSGGVKVMVGGKKVDIRSERRKYYDTIRTLVKDHGNFGISPSKYSAKDDNGYRLGGDFGLGLDEPRERQVARGPASVEGEPRAKMRAEKPSDHNLILKCKSIDCEVWFPDNIFVYKNDKLCIRAKGRYAGFLVNRLSIDSLQKLHPQAGNPPDPENGEDTTCDSPVNVDAEKLPGFVLPGNGIKIDGTGTAMAMGDIVIAYHPKEKSWAFGILSDGGPGGNNFGEASIAFNRILKGGGYVGNSRPRPEKYQKASKTDPAPVVLSGSIESPVVMLMLPGTAKRFKTGPNANGKYDFSPENVAKEGKAAFIEWAGTESLANARTKFRACAAAL